MKLCKGDIASTLAIHLYDQVYLGVCPFASRATWLHALVKIAYPLRYTRGPAGQSPLVQRRLETRLQLWLQVQQYRPGARNLYLYLLSYVLLQILSCPAANLLLEPMVCCLGAGQEQIVAHKCSHINELFTCLCLIILQNCYTPVDLEGLTAEHDHSCKIGIPQFILKASLQSMTTPVFANVGSWRLLHTSYSHQQYLRLRLVSSLYDTQVGRTSSLHFSLVLCCLLNKVLCRWTSFSCTSAYCNGHVWRHTGKTMLALKLLHSTCNPNACLPFSSHLPETYMLPQFTQNQAMPLSQHVPVLCRPSLEDSLC